jgi:hypothetical protein
MSNHSLLEKLFLPKSSKKEFTMESYLRDLENGKFKNKMNLGISEKLLGYNLQDFAQSPNALYIGSMGSGKSVAANFTILTWMLSNSENTILFIVDTLKGANDYQKLFATDDKTNKKLYEQVYEVLSSDVGVLRVLDLMYDEALARRDAFNEIQAQNITIFEKMTGKKVPRVIALMEEFHAIPYNILDFDRNYKQEGTAAWKFHQLMKIGRSYGIWFIACSQKGTKSDVPPEVVPNFTQKQIFRVSKAEASYFLSDVKAAEIRTDQKGRCETDYGSVQFPWIPMESQEKLLKKYMKPLEGECFYLTSKLIQDYLQGKSTEDLYKLKKISDLCKGIESFDADLVIMILHRKLGHKVELLNSKIDAHGVSMIVDWVKKNSSTKVAVGLRVNAKLSNKHIMKLRRGMQEYNCPRGILYTSMDDLPQNLYKLAGENNIEIVDHEDLTRLARQIEFDSSIAEELTPDHLADDAKESGDYQISHNISDVVLEESDDVADPVYNDNSIKVEVSKTAESKYIKTQQEIQTPAQDLIESAKHTNIPAADQAENAQELAEQMMLKQYKGTAKHIKRLPIRGQFAFPSDKQPLILVNLEKNKNDEVYRLMTYVLSNGEKKVIHKFFLDQQVRGSFNDDELDKLHVTGVADWNSQFDSINNRKVFNPNEFDQEVLTYFDNLKNYDLGNIIVLCWKEDSEVIKKYTEKCGFLRSKPVIIEDVYESTFGEALSKTELLQIHSKNIKRNDLFTPLDKTMEIYKIIF